MLTLYNRRTVLFFTLLLSLISFTSWGEANTTSVLNRLAGKFSVTNITRDKEGNAKTILSTVNNTLISEQHLFSVVITQNPNDTAQPTRFGILEFDPQSDRYKYIWIGDNLRCGKQTYSLSEGEANDNQLTLYSYNDANKSKWCQKNAIHFHDDGNFTAIITVPVEDDGEDTVLTAESIRITE